MILPFKIMQMKETEEKAKHHNMNSIQKVNKLCRSVLSVTAEDFAACDEMAKGQEGYMHPLKLATQAKYNDLGSHNQRVLAALKNLQDVIKSGEPIVKSKPQKL